MDVTVANLKEVHFSELETLWLKMVRPANEALHIVCPEVFWAAGAKVEFPGKSFGLAVGTVARWYALFGDQIERRVHSSQTVSIECFSAKNAKAKFLQDIGMTIIEGLNSVGIKAPAEDWIRVIASAAIGPYEGVRIKRVESGESSLVVSIEGKAIEYVNFTPELVDALLAGKSDAWQVVSGEFREKVEDAAE